MSQVQDFLNKYGCELQNGKESLKIWFSREDTAKSPICIDRLDDGDFAKRSVTSIDDHNSCIFSDADPEEFWEFLYSDKWNDSVILRVFSGELYNNLDLKLNEMLEEDTLAKHITSAYLKVKSETDKMKFKLDPETIRIEFTYYGKNLEKHRTSTAASFTPDGHLRDNLLANKSEHYLIGNEPGLSKDLSHKIEEFHLNSRSRTRTPSPTRNKFINISLGYYYSINSLDIKENIESDCDMLDMKRRGKLGMSKNTYGNSQSSIDETWQQRERRKKVGTRQRRERQETIELWEGQKTVEPPPKWVQRKMTDPWQRWAEMLKNCPSKGEDEGWEEEEEEKEGECDENDLEDIDVKGMPKGKSGSKVDKGGSKRRKKKTIDKQETFYPTISTELNLATMGKIMEGEKYLKFDNMTTKARKRFIITDERIVKIGRCLERMRKKKKAKMDGEMDCNKLIHQYLFKRVSGLKKNLYEFALLVLGITDSIELYHTIIWLCKDRNYGMGKWRNWFASRFKAKTAFQRVLQPNRKKASTEDDEQRSKEMKSSVADQGEASTRDFMAKKSKTGKGKIDKHKIDKGKAGKAGKGIIDKGMIEKGMIGKGKAGKGKAGKGEASESKAVKGKIDDGIKKSTSVHAEEYKKPLKFVWQKLEEEEAEEEEEEEEEEEGEEEGGEEEEEDKENKGQKESDAKTGKKEAKPRRYEWEISGDTIPARFKTEIVIPDFTQDEYVVRSEMILKAMNDFIIRKERVTSSKDLSFTSFAFIRPSFAQRLIQFQ